MAFGFLVPTFQVLFFFSWANTEGATTFYSFASLFVFIAGNLEIRCQSAFHRISVVITNKSKAIAVREPELESFVWHILRIFGPRLLDLSSEHLQ